MRVLFVTARNPHYPTITEYIERAVRALGHDIASFDDRAFTFPGRLRAAIPRIDRLDLSHLNRKLATEVRKQCPDLLLCAGGERILPETVEAARTAGTTTVLWTIDPVKPGDPRIALAPYFDFVFCGGTEMIEALKHSCPRNGPYWLPFACDPELHRPTDLSSEKRFPYSCDIAFVGSLHQAMYPNRIAMLEALSDLDLGVWGPGGQTIPTSSPLYSKIRGDEIRLEDWTRIYSTAKIILCAHYGGPGPACRQASPRVFEVLACGGFLLCDDEPDVRTLFEDGRDLSIFRDLDDLRKKARYYLTHDHERHEIAARGHAKVLAAHTYRHRVSTLVATVTEGN